MKRVGILILGLALTTFGVGSSANATRPEQVCFPLRGTVRALFSTTGCTSPVGLCTAGQFRSNFISGTTTFTATGLGGQPVGEASIVTPAAEPATTWSYSGIFTITTRLGSLVLSDVGVLDTVAGTFAELERPVSGTGTFAGATGRAYVTGTIIAGGTGFDGVVTGDICVPTH